MRDITKNFKGTLPEGFQLKEDGEGLLYLYNEDIIVAIFSSLIPPEMISQIAWRIYLTQKNDPIEPIEP